MSKKGVIHIMVIAKCYLPVSFSGYMLERERVMAGIVEAI
jgi:hypothetical protein